VLIEGVIASAPDADRRVTVTIPTFHPDQTFGPCPYMPRGGALPAVGARCLVALDETGIQEPWVPAWDGPDAALLEGPPGPAGATGPAGDSSATALGTIAYGAGYSAVSTGFRILKLPSGVVVCSGYVQKNALLATGDTVLTLPAGWRPREYQEYTVSAGHSNPGAAYAVMRVDIDTTGVAFISGAFPPPSGGSSPGYLSLSGVVFGT
jgi:hypothetical protein